MRAIQTMKQTRRMNLQGMESPVVVYAKRPNMVRQEISTGGRHVVMAYDGVTPWIVNPHTGANGPIQVTGPQADAIRQDSDFDGPLVDYREKGTHHRAGRHRAARHGQGPPPEGHVTAEGPRAALLPGRRRRRSR